ncbi:MAG: nitroreductase family protein [Phycisphaerae bacterium]|nr:nitroreductase family protein [Phycisphaerae bacterium]
MIKRLFYSLMPVRLQKTTRRCLLFMRLVRQSLYDIRRYVSSSVVYPIDDPVQLEAKITACSHVIEKGFTMPCTKETFGKQNVDILLAALQRYKSKGYSLENTQYRSAVTALKQYFEFHKGKNVDLSEIEKFLCSDNHHGQPAHSCFLKKTKDEIIQAAGQDFQTHAMNRYSIRNFDSTPVDIEILKDAVRIAQKSPSCCNRQCARVYIVETREKISAILDIQNGNRGFGDTIDKLLIIAANLSVFEGHKERNQAFIDGGMFAMSLLYALHYYGLGACALNWCVTKTEDVKLRKAINIQESHTILMMIGVGNLPEKVKLCRSQRKHYEDLISLR